MLPQTSVVKIGNDNFIFDFYLLIVEVIEMFSIGFCDIFSWEFSCIILLEYRDLLLRMFYIIV